MKLAVNVLITAIAIWFFNLRLIAQTHIHIGSQRELFVDRALIESMENSRVFHGGSPVGYR